MLWVESDLKRYWPGLGDHVIGIVTDKGAEDYKLDIGASSKALLPVLAFDGASKRNRPHLAVGALVYARVVLANKDMEPEVTCAAPPGVNARDWVTKESVFGELSGGHGEWSAPQASGKAFLSNASAASSCRRRLRRESRTVCSEHVCLGGRDHDMERVGERRAAPGPGTRGGPSRPRTARCRCCIVVCRQPSRAESSGNPKG